MWQGDTFITWGSNWPIQIFLLLRNIYNSAITFTFFVFSFYKIYLLHAQDVEPFLKQSVITPYIILFSTCATGCDHNFSYAIKHIIVKFGKWFFSAEKSVPGRITLKFHFQVECFVYMRTWCNKNYSFVHIES